MQKWLFSETLLKLSPTKRIAYIAVMTALSVVANMFFEVKFMQTQFSFTIVVCAVTGLLLGPLAGFGACFLGDLVGFLYNSGGYLYYPWMGIALGLIAVIFSLCLRLPFEGKLPLKLAIASLLTFLICTVGINTTAFYFLYAKGTTYFSYLGRRLLVEGQIWNSLVNYALLFFLVPILASIKPLKIKL